MISRRQFEILTILANSTLPVSIATIAQKLRKSERTIRYDLQDLRNSLRAMQWSIKTASKSGLYIPAHIKSQVMEFLLKEQQRMQAECDYLSDEGRRRNLFLYLVMQAQPVSADELAEYLYVSRSTILRDIQETDAMLYEDVKIKAVIGQGFILEGEELAIRKLAVRILAALFKGSYASEDWYVLLPGSWKDQMDLQAIEHISNTIKKQNALYDVWISNSAFLAILAYSMVMKIRIRNQQLLTTIESEELTPLELAYSKDILVQLGYEHAIPEEICGYGIMMQEYRMYIRSKPNERNDQLSDAIHTMLNQLEAQSTLVFDLKMLYQDLFQHLQQYHGRQQEMEEYSPILQQVRQEYPTFYELAKQLRLLFDQYMQTPLSENEITYIAIYLYKNVQHKESLKHRILLVCATGKGLSNLLATRIRHVFPNLHIVDSMSVYQIETVDNHLEIDFIISTISLKTKYPVVKISPVLSLQDIQRIQEFLHYGKLLDKIPFPASEEVSFSSKVSYQKKDGCQPLEQQLMKDASQQVSALIMALLEYVAKLPPEYQMDQDQILGLTIHLVLAIPRWYQEGCAEDDVEDAYQAIQQQHPKVFALIEKYFRMVEESLLVTISISERYAFYLYILQEDLYGKS